MLKKTISTLLIALVVNLAVSSVLAETKEEKEAKFVQKVKTQVMKIGTGRDARVQVKLKDGTKLKGYVSQINETNFVVMNEITAAPTEVPYSKTKQIKGNNLSTGAKIAIGVGIVVLAITIAAIVGRSQ